MTSIFHEASRSLLRTVIDASIAYWLIKWFASHKVFLEDLEAQGEES